MKMYKDTQRVMREPFNADIHKKVFVNYLEVIIAEDGEIMYAVPSHQEKLIAMSCEKLAVSREELNDLCPPEYYCDFMEWLSMQCGGVAVWNSGIVGKPNNKQKESLDMLIKEGLYQGVKVW